MSDRPETTRDPSWTCGGCSGLEAECRCTYDGTRSQATGLNRLSPAALKAAMTTGAACWGQWGSVAHHALYVDPIDPALLPVRRRGMCRCGCRKKDTHSVKANGVALMQGCEMAARRWAKEMSRARR